MIDHAQYDLCVCDLYSTEIIAKFLVGQMSGFVENFNIGIFSDSVNVIHVKFCTMVDHRYVKQFQMTILYSRPMNLKLSRIDAYINEKGDH